MNAFYLNNLFHPYGLIWAHKPISKVEPPVSIIWNSEMNAFCSHPIYLKAGLSHGMALRVRSQNGSGIMTVSMHPKVNAIQSSPMTAMLAMQCHSRRTWKSLRRGL